jgi:hypothetical protein
MGYGPGGETRLRLSRKSGIAAIVIALAALLCSACGGNVSPTVSYKAPAFLPFSITLGKHDNNPTITGNASLITELGVFSIGAQYELPPPVSDTIRVILRNRRTGFDKVYQIRTAGDQFAAVVNGKTSISVSQDQVLIDVTDGTIQQITFKRVNNQIAEAQGSGNGISRAVHTPVNRWDTGWNRSWYKPFMLSRWAYDDSTVTKWYGIGFVWFFIRLILACILGACDVVLTILFLIGQVAVLFFGSSVWPGGLG